MREGEMEQIIEELESYCHEKLQLAIRTVDGLGLCFSSLIVRRLFEKNSIKPVIRRFFLPENEIIWRISG